MTRHIGKPFVYFIEDEDGDLEWNSAPEFSSGRTGGFAVYHQEHVANLERRISELERDRDTGRLDGWNAAREQAAHLIETEIALANARKVPVAAGGLVAGSRAIRAMNPPSEWQCAELPPVCGAAPNDQRLSADEIKAMVGEEDFRKKVIWPHDDGFGGGLTERNRNGQDPQSQSKP